MNKSVKQVIADFEFMSAAAKEKANKCLHYNTAQAQVFELCNQLDYAVNNSNNLDNELKLRTDKFETDLKQVLITSNKLSDELTKANNSISEYKARIDNLLDSKFKLIQEKNTEVDNLTAENSKLVTELELMKNKLNYINDEFKLSTIKINTKSSFKIKLINLINR